MATSIIMSLIVALIIILVLTLVVLCIRQPQQNKMKNDKFTLEMLSYSPIFSKIVDAIIPPNGFFPFVVEPDQQRFEFQFTCVIMLHRP